MTYSPLDQLTEFHHTFSPEQHADGLEKKVERRARLIEEESEEVLEALEYLDQTDLGCTSSTFEEAMADLAGELADLLYVVYGTAEEFGIPLDKVFEAVHAANMSKVWDDGLVHRNEFGKVIKPPNFKKANIYEVLYGVEESSEH